MTQTILDGSKLKAISHASHTAEVTMTALAMRERLRNFSDITRTRNQLIREGEKIVDADYMAFWKGLQDAGVGVIVYGRKGKPDRFDWHYSMKKVAKAALEGTNETAEKIGGNVKKKAADPVAKAAKKLAKKPVEAKRAAIPGLVTNKPATVQASRKDRLLYIPLRKDFSFEVSIPTDLSPAEAEVIGNALRRLSA
jgi:hypothetical protein